MSTEMKRERLGIVIDTNVIISALVFGGDPKRLIEVIIKERWKVFTSPQLISELLETLRQKFLFSEEKIKLLESSLLNLFKVVYPRKELFIVRDIKDNKVLEAALESNSNIIITGDKDLLVLKKYKRILIVTSKEFLDFVEFGS